MANKILIIDDDVDFSQSIIEILKTKDYTMISASDGNSGFEKAKKEKPDLILLDVMMTTKTEGFDTARKLKAEKSTAHIPVIMLTGIRKDMNLPFGFESDKEWLPVVSVLEKPVKPDILLQVIEKALR